MKMNKKSIIIISIIAVLVVIIAMPKPGRPGAKMDETLDLKLDDSVSTTVSTEKVQVGSIEETIFTIGSIDPVETFNVNAKVSGEVKETYFEIGDRVSKGDVLFEINQDSFDINKSQTLTQLKNGLEQSRLNLEQAKKSFEEQSQLFESGAASKAVYDNSKTAFDNAQIAYDNALSNYNSSVSSLSEQKDNYVQKSPVDGVVVGKNISKSIFASGQNGYTIVPESQYVVNASITSKYVKAIQKGQGASIYVNTLDRTYAGEVLSISTVGQRGAYPIEISIDGDDALMSGLYSEVKIVVDTHEEAALISKNALIKEGETAYVYRVKSDQTVEKVSVITGIEDDTHVEILQNLNINDEIVVRGKEYLTADAKVMIK